MKTLLSTGLLALAAAGLIQPVAARAGMPQPMCVFYGQAKDGYGQPYLRDANVLLLKGTNQIASQTIHGSLSPGVNFALYVHLDDGRTATPYSPRAVHSGDMVSIIVKDPEGQKTIMEAQAIPPVSQPGDMVFVYATAGTDENHDGIPDQWEWELIANSGGVLHSLADVHPNDDFDGDGMSNLQEYLAGTFPFLDYDYFAIDHVEATANHRLQLTFLTVPGKVYTAYSTTNLSKPAWETCAFALTDTGLTNTAPLEGNGDWMSIYVPVAEPSSRFFRLEVR